MTAAPAGPSTLTPREFAWISAFLLEWTGIELKDGRQAMVVGRLDRRLRHHGIGTFTEYFALLGPGHPEETRMAIDLLTTNETYFFREPAHFEGLPAMLPDALTRQQTSGSPVRVWSAACSSGEEAHSIALTLAGCLGQRQWEVVGTDISSRVLETARHGLYPVEAAERIPRELLRFCMRGKGEYEGFMTVDRALRNRMSFHHANLTQALPELGTFDVVFLRNVMIYFGKDTKRELVARIARILRPGGYLLVGHAETLSGLDTGLVAVAPSVYRVATI